jgi:zinc transport system permease protein
MSAWHSIISALPFDWAQYEFMRHALLAVILMSPLFALLGCMVINNHLAFFSEAMGHAALTGIALGAVTGLLSPTWSVMLFGILLAVAICILRRYSAASADTIVGLAMAFTVALGVVLLSRGGGFAKYSRYLVGDVLTITPGEIGRILVVLVVVLGSLFLFYNRIFVTSLNRTLGQSRGMRVWMLEGFFMALVALVVTSSISWVGLLVINSLVILPAAAARNLARSTPTYIWTAAAIGLVSGIAGLVTSFYTSTATGATIVLFAMAFFVVSLPFRPR